MAKKTSAEEKLANIQAAQLAAQVANMAAQLEFQKQRMTLLELPQFQFMSQMQIDELAFKKAEAAYARALQEATLTGTYNGQPTLAWLTEQARMTGVLNGQQTLEGKLNDAQIAQMNKAIEVQTHQMLLEDEKFGFERERWGAEFTYQMQKELRDYGLNQAGVTGYFNGQSTLAREQMEGQQANQYLSLMASLQSNPFKQARVLANTPNGMRSIADAWAGKFQMAGQTGVGTGPGAPQMADLTTAFDPNTGQPIQAQTPGVYFQQPVQGAVQPGAMPTPAPYSQVQPVGSVGGYGYNDERSYYSALQMASGMPASLPRYYQNPQGQWEQTPTYGTPSTSGEYWTGGTPTYKYQENPNAPTGYSQDMGTGYTVSPPGVAAPTYAYNYEATPGGQTQVYPPGVQAPVQGNQVSTTTPRSTSEYQSINPGKINAKNYANTNKFFQDLGWQQIEEEQGISRTLAQDAFKRSLPKYGGPKMGRVQMAGAA